MQCSSVDRNTSTLKMQAADSSKILTPIYKTIWHNTPEGINFHFHCQEYFMLRESNKAKMVNRCTQKLQEFSASCKRTTKYRIDLSVNEALIHGVTWLEFQTMMYPTYSEGL
jgi:hypothetical protein